MLRPAPGQHDVTLRLQAIGAQQGLNWLLDGQLVGSSDKAGALQLLTLQQPGAHALTAMDGRGSWARVGFELQAGVSKTAAQAPMTGASPAALR